MFSRKNNYIFLDESGKPEVFSSKGTNLVSAGTASRFLVISAVRSNNQLKLQQEIMDFRTKLLKDESLLKIFSSAYALDNFHASNDYPEVREKFYRFIASSKIKIDVIVAEKLKCYAFLQNNPGKLYGFMAGQLLKNICHQANSTEIIFSRKDSKLKLRQELEVETERIRLNYINNNKITNNFILKYQHNPHHSHGGLQIADYVSYAIFQYFERNDDQWYKLIQNNIGKITDICNKKYFTRGNPLQLST